MYCKQGCAKANKMLAAGGIGIPELLLEAPSSNTWSYFRVPTTAPIILSQFFLLVHFMTDILQGLLTKLSRCVGEGRFFFSQESRQRTIPCSRQVGESSSTSRVESPAWKGVASLYCDVLLDSMRWNADFQVIWIYINPFSSYIADRTIRTNRVVHWAWRLCQGRRTGRSQSCPVNGRRRKRGRKT
jgi:hypothetical protein